MIKRILYLIPFMFLACTSNLETNQHVITSDIDLFWEAYDTIIKTEDSLGQIALIEQMYLAKGSPGLKGIMAAKSYIAADYIQMINGYPQYLNSIRENTLQAKGLSESLGNGIEKLRDIYPDLEPAKIYFTMGAMRSGGTTIDSLVLIGSELAMVDKQANTSEFEGWVKDWIEGYIATQPLDNIILLNIHEYVHTQQNPIPNALLYQCLYEGIAEFVSVTAMGVPSNSPAIAFGKAHPEVMTKFEHDMFYERTHEWLWSSAPNEFGVRDLGYYIGYEIAERYYNQSDGKAAAISRLIRLDYQDLTTVDALIDQTRVFSKSIESLKEIDAQKRPSVVKVKEFKNGDQAVDPTLQEITVVFSEPLNGRETSIDYGVLGAEAFPKIMDRYWRTDSMAWTIKVELEPNTLYQILISNNFRTLKNVPLKPYLIEFKTKNI